MHLQHTYQQSAIRLKAQGFQVEATGPAAREISQAVVFSVLFIGMCIGISHLARS
jgi:hypothetical protein